MPENTSYASDLREAMTGEPSADRVDAAIKTLSAAVRLQKEAAELRADKSLMAAVRKRVAELTGGRKGGNGKDDDDER